MVSYLAAIWRCRYFWMSLVKMDLRTRYRRSVLGLGWSLLHPISMTIIFCVVFQRIFQSDTVTYAPYLMSGLVFWNYFQTSALMGCNCFHQSESYIRQFPSPLASSSPRSSATLAPMFKTLRRCQRTLPRTTIGSPIGTAL